MLIPNEIKSGLEKEFWMLWCEQFPDLPVPVPQYRFIAIAAGGPGKGLRTRLKAFGKKHGDPTGAHDWKADFAWLDVDPPLIVEIEGKGSGHESWFAVERDIAKYNMMTVLGYRLLRYSRFHIKDSKTARYQMLRQIADIVGGEGHYMKDFDGIVGRLNKLLVEG